MLLRMDPDPQDSLVTSSEDVIQIEKGTSSVTGRLLALSDNRDVQKKKTKAVNDRFPWLSSFQKLSRSLIGNSSIKHLLNLITLYTEHVSRDVTASYPKPNQAAKLKQSMINIIGLFHSCYININSPLDEGIYLDKMSNLLTMYMDMEIKASRRAKESVQRVASKVVSSLFIVLNDSPEYILDTILNARYITVKKFREICIPIFKKVTSDLQPHQDMTYVRCLLIFKLWKRLVARGKERNSLNRLAVARLSPPPPQLLELIQRGLFVNVLPPLPPNKKPALVTRFYLLAKFNLRDSIKALMKLKADSQLTDLSTTLDASRFFDVPFSQENFVFSDDTLRENTISKDCSVTDPIWTSCSDSPSTICISDSASEIVICDDSPSVSNKDRFSKSKKTNKKKESPNKIRDSVKIKKQGSKIMNRTKLSIPKEQNFPKFQIVEFQKIKLNYHLSGDQNLNKPSPSSTVNDDCVIVSDTQTSTTYDHPVLKIKKTENTNSICNVTINKFEPSSVTLHENNESVIKAETEHETALAPVSTSKTSDSRQLGNSKMFPNLNEVLKISPRNHEKTILSEDCSQDVVSKSGQISIKNELKLNSCDSISCIKDSTYIETNKFNNESTDIGNLKSFELINISDKCSSLSECTEKNKSTLSVDTIDSILNNDYASTATKYDGNKQNLDYMKTGFGEVCDVSKNSFTDAGNSFSKCDLKVESFLPRTSVGEGTVIENNSPDTGLEEPNVKTREITVLSYIPKSATVCDLQTTKPALSDQFESLVKNQIVIKSEKENRNIQGENPNNTIYTLSVKKEFNCKKDDVPINSSKSNILHKIEEINNQVQDYNADISSRNQEGCKNSCFKQISKKDLNSCLLHNILGEDDCLKNCSNECLLRKPKSNKENVLFEDSENRQTKSILSHPEPAFSDCIAIGDWNDSSETVKKEKELDSKSLNSMFYENKSSLDFNLENSNSNEDKFINNNLQRLPTETTLNKLHYQLSQEPSDTNTDYYYESEDSNLVIDEDVDPFKEQIETVMDGSCSDAEFISDTSYSIDLKSNVKESKAIKALFVDAVSPAKTDVVCKDVIEENILDKIRNNELSVCEKNMNKNKLASANLFVQAQFEESVQSNLNSKANFLSEKPLSQISTLKCENSKLSHTNYVHDQCCPPSELKQKESLEYHQAKLSSNPKLDSNVLLSQKKITSCHPGTRSSQFIAENSSLYASKTNATMNLNQTQQVKFLNLSCISEPSPPLNVLPDTQHLRAHTQSTSGGVLLNSKRTIAAQVDISSQVNCAVDKLQNANKKNEVHKKVNSSSPESGNTCLKNFAREVLPLPPSGLSNNVRRSPSYSKSCDPLRVPIVKSNDNLFNKSDSVLDPLSQSQKNVADSREIVDFEFNVFPVAHEVEVCSAIDPISLELACPGSSEIGHPDWPIANEQNVTDATYSTPTDQYLYTSNITSDLCYAMSEMNQCSSVSTLELQQVSVDFRYPNNTNSYADKSKFNLHFKTLEVDYNLCCSQRKFKEFYLSHDVPPTIPAPFPPHGRLDNMKTSVRCGCEQCSDNHRILLSNYNILTQFRNSRLRPQSIYSISIDPSLSDQNCDSDCSLPLKKRKTLTNSKSNEEPTLTSYPNTPMISIAQLELASFEQQNQISVSAAAHQRRWKDVSQYRVEVHNNPLNLAHYSSSSTQQADLVSQTKTGKNKTTKRRKSSR